MKIEIEQYIHIWENRCYKNGIPDDVPREIFDKVPSYKAIAMAILKNDLSILGIERKPCLAYVALKRIEISQRPETKKSDQLTLF
jgi:predicted phosphoadenosine phosphosulfate sulfurtransferase